MILEVNAKMSSKERVKAAGERIAREIISNGFKGDIEMVGLLGALLDSTGADTVKIYNEMKQTP